MIGKIKNLPAGDHLGRLATYLSGLRAQRLAGFCPINLATDNLAHAVTLIDAQAGLSRRARKPVAHVSVSYSPTDIVTTAQMYEDAHRVLLALGAEQSQAFVVVHDDKRYRHFHVVYNRVGTDGRCISSSNTKRKIESILRKLEKEQGLRVVRGRHAPAEDPAAVGSQADNRFKGPRAARRGYVQPPAEVVSAMREGQSRQEINARLGKLGWRLEDARQKSGQKSGGLILYGPAGALSRASDCGRDCSGPALARRFFAPSTTPIPQIEVAPPTPTPLVQRGYIQPPPEVVLAMSQAQSRCELDARLKGLGWVLGEARSRPGQKHGGLVLSGPAGRLARASDCGRESSGPALARRFAAADNTAYPEIKVSQSPTMPLPLTKRGEALAKVLRKARGKPKALRIVRSVQTAAAKPANRPPTNIPEL